MIDAGVQTYLQSINAGIAATLAEDPLTLFIGEDILDPYGGAFKVAKGLSTRFPGQVLGTPISEAAIAALAGGAALRGGRVVAEIMFADFVGLVFDQVFNHLTKYPQMYRDCDRMHVVIRTAAGGGRGYGPTHSQNPEKFFAGIPGLAVFAPSELHTPGKTLHAALNSGRPSLFVESKMLYARPLLSGAPESGADWQRSDLVGSATPGTTVMLSNARGGRADATILTYGASFGIVEAAAAEVLMEDELTVDVFVLENLTDFDETVIRESAERSGFVLTVEEGTRAHGFGAEWLARLLDAGWSGRGRRIAMDAPILPSAKHLEEQLLPNAYRVIAELRAGA